MKYLPLESCQRLKHLVINPTNDVWSRTGDEWFESTQRFAHTYEESIPMLYLEEALNLLPESVSLSKSAKFGWMVSCHVIFEVPYFFTSQSLLTAVNECLIKLLDKEII